MELKWKRVPDDNITSFYHTASTMYVTDGYKIWKGRYRIFDCIMSYDKWNLERISDGKILNSENTAKECMRTAEYYMTKEVKQ